MQSTFATKLKDYDHSLSFNGNLRGHPPVTAPPSRPTVTNWTKLWRVKFLQVRTYPVCSMRVDEEIIRRYLLKIKIREMDRLL